MVVWWWYDSGVVVEQTNLLSRPFGWSSQLLRLSVVTPCGFGHSRDCLWMLGDEYSDDNDGGGHAMKDKI